MMHSQFHLHTLTDFSPESMATSRSMVARKSRGKRSSKIDFIGQSVKYLYFVQIQLSVNFPKRLQCQAHSGNWMDWSKKKSRKTHRHTQSAMSVVLFCHPHIHFYDINFQNIIEKNHQIRELATCVFQSRENERKIEDEKKITKTKKTNCHE